ncbi:hypothetical protein KR51_00020590 [Rubidibacter lacunae KORDI 51-2]|uniref:Uncharacterized protein n=1 Tax=Rubidibacter lacunae KORDI 51-2 TaxID=582515 RepID=U5DKP0_9CHRO|nr:hypothetical protein KR51_00020590 [Rubidibacter lacunae KORDI 51-2]
MCLHGCDRVWRFGLPTAIAQQPSAMRSRRLQGLPIRHDVFRAPAGLLGIELLNWIVNGYKFRSVGKCRLDLHVLDHLGNAIHDVCSR